MKGLFYLLLAVSFSIAAQPNPESSVKIDSLKGVIDEASHDTTKIKALIAWDELIYLFNPDLDLALNKKVDSLCRNNLDKNLSFEEREFFLEHRITALGNLGAHYYELGNYEKALSYHNRQLQLAQQIDSPFLSSEALNGIGTNYYAQGKYALAIKYYNRSLKIKELNEMRESLGLNYNNIGLIYYDQDKLAKATEYFDKAISVSQELDDKIELAYSYANKSAVLAKKKEYAEAIDLLLKTKEEFKALGDLAGYANALSNLGQYYEELKQFNKAEESFERALSLNKEMGNQSGIAFSLNSLGSLFFKKGQLDKALKYNQEALELASKIGSTYDIKQSSRSLWKLHKSQGRYKKALQMHELFIESRDSLESENNRKEVIRQEYKYQYEKQAIQDSIENAKREKIAQATIAKEKAENERRETIQYALFGGLGLVLIFAAVVFNRFRITQKQKNVIEEQKHKVDSAFLLLEKKNGEIMDSINYAQRIQAAIMPQDTMIEKHLPNSFIFYKPKDVVAGDFYWMEPRKDALIFAAADCTGHGVPGAMVSVVCNNGLNRSVREFGLLDPGLILDKTREIVTQEFEKSERDVRDGMDIALISLSKKTKEDREREEMSESVGVGTHSVLHYAGAHNPLWIVRKGGNEIEEIKADKQPIGAFEQSRPFTTHTVTLSKGDTLYIFSDGFADQFGGEKGKKFKSKNFKNLLLNIVERPMDEQEQLLEEKFEAWKGDREQLDDVCVMGVRI